MPAYPRDEPEAAFIRDGRDDAGGGRLARRCAERRPITDR